MPKRKNPSASWGQAPIELNKAVRDSIDAAVTIASRLLADHPSKEEFCERFKGILTYFIVAKKRSGYHPVFEGGQIRESCESPMPRGKHLQSIFMELNEVCEKYLDLLNHFETPEYQELLCKDLHASSKNWPKVDKQLEKMMGAAKASANYFFERTLEALHHIPEVKGGRIEDKDQKELIQEAGRWYRDATGKSSNASYDSSNDHFVGPFLDFMNEILQTIGYPPHSVDALGQQIKRVMHEG